MMRAGSKPSRRIGGVQPDQTGLMPALTMTSCQFGTSSSMRLSSH
jgi:hypothetical protein